MFMFEEVRPIFARSTASPSLKPPARIFSNCARFSSMERSRNFDGVPGCLDVAAVELDLLGAFLIDVGEAVLDEVHGAVVEELEVVRGEIKIIAPIEAEPFHVRLDGFDVFGFLFFGIGVVEAEVALRARVFLGDAEIQADGFRVADVQVAVRLRRETGDGGLVFSGGEVGGDDLADEIEFWCVGHGKKWKVPSEQ